MRSDRQADGSNRCRTMVKDSHERSIHVLSAIKLQIIIRTTAQIAAVGSWEKTMSKFLIEDNYYIVTLNNCYALAKYTGARKRGEKEEDGMDMICYHSTVGDCLKRYCEIRRREATAKVCDGTIEDMMRILSSENERLSERLKTLREEIGE